MLSLELAGIFPQHSMHTPYLGEFVLHDRSVFLLLFVAKSRAISISFCFIIKKDISTLGFLQNSNIKYIYRPTNSSVQISEIHSFTALSENKHGGRDGVIVSSGQQSGYLLPVTRVETVISVHTTLDPGWMRVGPGFNPALSKGWNFRPGLVFLAFFSVHTTLSTWVNPGSTRDVGQSSYSVNTP